MKNIRILTIKSWRDRHFSSINCGVLSKVYKRLWTSCIGQWRTIIKWDCMTFQANVRLEQWMARAKEYFVWFAFAFCYFKLFLRFNYDCWLFISTIVEQFLLCNWNLNALANIWSLYAIPLFCSLFWNDAKCQPIPNRLETRITSVRGTNDRKYWHIFPCSTSCKHLLVRAHLTLISCKFTFALQPVLQSCAWHFQDEILFTAFFSSWDSFTLLGYEKQEIVFLRFCLWAVLWKVHC